MQNILSTGLQQHPNTLHNHQKPTHPTLMRVRESKKINQYASNSPEMPQKSKINQKISILSNQTQNCLKKPKIN